MLDIESPTESQGQFIHSPVNLLSPDILPNCMEERERCPEFCCALFVYWRPGQQKPPALSNIIILEFFPVALKLGPILHGAMKKQ